MAIEGPSGSGFDDQFWPTDAVNPGILWESPHPLSIVGVKNTQPKCRDTTRASVERNVTVSSVAGLPAPPVYCRGAIWIQDQQPKTGTTGVMTEMALVRVN